ncbi:MAG TPA: mandelate racemase/muconate lactonizing enzyme family protein [Chloroflexota bacterium]|nr:mandelate racemase/muconate lactonizing enzyme family protein [Chloroflexota bacterium]
MRITRVDVYGYDLHYRHGHYVMSRNQDVTALASTVVRLTADSGMVGWAEVCPLGPRYLPAFAGGARAALRELAPALLGVDPRELHVVRGRLDGALRGHEYAKSPLDIACWDLLGKAAGCSVTTLLGGRQQERFPLYEAVPLGSPDAMVAFVQARRDAGLHRFQLKVGADPYEDCARVRRVVEATGDEDMLIVDANGGWRLQDALVAARLLGSLPRVYLEQPCATLEECLLLRQHTDLPMILDEVITDVQTLIRAYQAGGLEAFNLKLSKVGGLTPAKQLRDLADTLGLRVTIEDTWGGDLTTAAVSHLAASTRREALFTVSFFNDWVADHIAGYQPRSSEGSGASPEGPGLGIEPDLSLLGEPMFAVSA